MDENEVLARLTDVFADVFDDEDLVITEKTCADDIEDWDSLEHINLVLAVENEFSIKFNMKEVNDFKSVGDMIASIVTHLQ